MITTIAELDEAAASETVPTPAPGRNGLPDLIEWVSESPARARAAWIFVSTRGSSGDPQYDAALREQAHLFKRCILRKTQLDDVETDRLDTGPGGVRLWMDRVVRA